MKDIDPIKRNESLKNVSRDHHFGLLFCWKLRTGVKTVDPSRIKKYADHFYKEQLLPHFRLEEKHIFPLLGEESTLIQTAMKDHKKLRELFEEKEISSEALNEIEKTLEQHIRFEERVLFKELQRLISEEVLTKALENHTDRPVDDNWEDKFWEEKKS